MLILPAVNSQCGSRTTDRVAPYSTIRKSKCKVKFAYLAFHTSPSVWPLDLLLEASEPSFKGVRVNISLFIKVLRLKFRLNYFSVTTNNITTV